MSSPSLAPPTPLRKPPSLSPSAPPQAIRPPPSRTLSTASTSSSSRAVPVPPPYESTVAQQPKCSSAPPPLLPSRSSSTIATPQSTKVQKQFSQYDESDKQAMFAVFDLVSCCSSRVLSTTDHLVPFSVLRISTSFYAQYRLYPSSAFIASHSFDSASVARTERFPHFTRSRSSSCTAFDSSSACSASALSRQHSFILDSVLSSPSALLLFRSHSRALYTRRILLFAMVHGYLVASSTATRVSYRSPILLLVATKEYLKTVRRNVSIWRLLRHLVSNLVGRFLRIKSFHTS